MNISYKRDFHRNYLIIQGKDGLDYDSYPIRMLQNNRISMLLPCQIQRINNQPMLYYEITSMQSLSSYCETRKLTKEILVWLMEALLETLENMEEYLLDGEFLLLMPEYIYMSAADKRIGFCCWPFEQEENLSILQFTEYLLPEIDHKDQGAVVLGYELYRKAMEDQFEPEKIKQELYKESFSLRNNRFPDSGNEDEVEKLSEAWDEGRQKNGESLLSEEYLAEERKKREETIEILLQSEPEAFGQKHPMVSAFGGGIILMGVIFLVCMKQNNYISLPVFIGITGIVFLILTATGVILHFISRKKFKSGIFKMNKEKTVKNIGKGKGNSLKEEGEKNWNKEEKNRAYDMDEIPDILIPQETTLLSVKSEEKNPLLKNIIPSNIEDIPIKEGITILGKLEGTVDVLLKSPAVSRVHARIKREAMDCYIMDLNSKNGTRVNDLEVIGNAEILLKEGDRITLGDIVYVFQL